PRDLRRAGGRAGGGAAGGVAPGPGPVLSGPRGGARPRRSAPSLIPGCRFPGPALTARPGPDAGMASARGVRGAGPVLVDRCRRAVPDRSTSTGPVGAVAGGALSSARGGCTAGGAGARWAGRPSAGGKGAERLACGGGSGQHVTGLSDGAGGRTR